MGSVAVFDADVVIGHLDADALHHEQATARVRANVESGARRLLSAVTYSEILVWPARRLGADGISRVRKALLLLQIEVVPADESLSERTAVVRARTGLKLPGSYAVATALAAKRAGDDVRLETFDDRVAAAFEQLR